MEGQHETEDKVLTIDVKPGWKAGTKITFPKEGDQTPYNIPADIVFVIKDKPHSLFTRDGSDIKYKARISLRDVSMLDVCMMITQVFRFCTLFQILMNGYVNVQLGEHYKMNLILCYSFHRLS